MAMTGFEAEEERSAEILLLSSFEPVNLLTNI